MNYKIEYTTKGLHWKRLLLSIILCASFQLGWGQEYKLEYDLKIGSSEYPYTTPFIYCKTVGGFDKILYPDYTAAGNVFFKGSVLFPKTAGELTIFDINGTGDNFSIHTQMSNYIDIKILNSECDGYMRYYPVMTDALDEPIGDDCNFPLDGTKTFSGKYSGFPFYEDYYWEFSVDGTNWKLFPIQYRKEVTLTARELFGCEPELKVEDYINQYIYIRTGSEPYYTSKERQPDAVSKVVQYKIVASPPNITKIDTIAPKCSTDNGIAKIFIDRDLSFGEVLMLDVYNAGTFTKVPLNSSKISASTPYSLSLYPGDYYITYQSQFTRSDGTFYPSEFKTTSSFTIRPTSAVTFTAKPTEVKCYGDSTGSIALNILGGTAPYKYSKNNASLVDVPQNNTINGLKAGTYSLKIQDNNGCESNSQNIIVDSNSKVTASITSTPALCKGDNGSITLNALGGKESGYQYSYSPYTTWTGFTDDKSLQILNLPAGEYDLKVKDGNGCIAKVADNVTDKILHAEIGEPTNAVTATITGKIDITCHGANNGVLILKASGGNGSYKFSLQKNGVDYKTGTILKENTETRIEDIEPNTYTLSLSDLNNCSATSWSGSVNHNSLVFTDPTQVKASIVEKKDVTCNGGFGSITLTASGGTKKYQYTLFKDGVFNQNGSFLGDGTVFTISNLSGGTYSATIKDDYCDAIWTDEPFNHNVIELSEPDAIIATVSKKDPSCDGAELSSITLQATGGSGSYKYIVLKNGGLYESGSFKAKLDISNPPEGTYSVALTDEIGGCAVTTWNGVADHNSFQIIKPKPITIESTDTVKINCYGDVNGAITVHAKGGVGTLNYNWSGDRVAENTNTITGLGAGTYKVTISDSTTCPIDQTYILKSKYTKINLTFDKTDISCSNNSDGFAKVTATGGKPGVLIPYTYLWDTGATTNTISNKGTKRFYKVTVTDSIGCSTTDSVYLDKPDPLTVTLKPYNLTGFKKGDGAIKAIVQGGNKGAYKFEWTGVSSGTDSVSNLDANTNYSVLVTDSLGCTASAAVSLTQPDSLKIDLGVKDPILCNGYEGALKAKASGGVAFAKGFVYTWMKINDAGVAVPLEVPTQTVAKDVWAERTGLVAGTYMVQVNDSFSNALLSSNTIRLEEPKPLAISSTIDSVKCHGASTGKIQTLITGGTRPYTYWLNKVTPVDSVMIDLKAGIYPITVIDAHKCEISHSPEVSQPSAALSVTLARKELLAYHAADAELVATVSGGTFSPDKPCSFDWTGSDSKTKTASSLASGTYKLKVTDNNGCTAEDSAIFIDPLKVDIVVKDTILCNRSLGRLAARAVGGEPSLTGLPYKYTWYKYDVKTGVSTLLYPGDSNDSLATDLPEGSYSVKIDDNHGRILQTVPFHLAQPEMVQISVDSTNISCKGDNNGSIKVIASGGNGGYTYLWKDGSTQNERTNLPPGKYTIEVFDRKNCQPVPVSRTITITEPEKLTLNLQKRDVLVACDGKIEAIVAGGTRPYRFRWNDGEETVDSVKTLLCDGNYKVEVIDKNLCTATASILLPPPLKVKISVQDSVKCFGDNNGSLIVYAQGGVPYKIGKPYKYSWKKQNASGMYEELTVEKDSVAGLTAGWYALNITDSIGVTLRADSVFYLSQPEALAIRIQKTDVLCHGASTGAISAVVTGGLKPYTLKWSNDSTTADLNSLKAGVYILTATDRHGCTIQHSVSIEQHDSLMIGFTNIIAPTTSTACNGSLTASVSGGVRPYTYHWSVTNATTATADHLCYGTFYTVTVTDSVGCSAQVTKTSKFAPPPFVVSISVQDSIQCHGTAVGAIAAKVSGGIPFTTGKPYIYFWKKKNSTGEYHSIANSNDSTITQLTSGWYAFSVQDAELNISTELVEIHLPEPDTLALNVSHTDISCKDLHNGSASVVASGGVLPYAYKWSNGETSPSIDNLAPGDYWIEVTDKHGCISRQSITITEPELLSVTFQPKLISEYNVCDGSLKTVVRGGTAPFSYAWTGVNSTADAVSSLCAGEYSVTVTDAHGCSANQKTTFSNPPALRLSLVVQDSIKCNGNVQGVLVATAQGGIPFASGKKYRYTWKKKNSRGVFETMPAYTDSSATDLATGTYACTITDANGISLHQDSVILLPEPTELQLVVQQTNIGCSGADEGSATIIPSGGSLPYSYAWSTGDKTATVRNLSAGPYIVRVTDRNGCVAARQMYISKAAPLYLFLYKKQPVCYQSCDGEIKTTVSGGIAPYSFQWTGSASTGSEAGSLCAGKYSLLVTDAAGCTIQKNDSLQHPAQLPLQLGSDRYICSGQTIRYDISIPSKTGITYRWAGPDGFTATTPAVNLTQPGTYSASVTNAAGCSNSGSVTLSPSGITVANEFALPTQAFVNERIVIVNTTYPAPDSIRWVLPAKAQILSSGQSYTEFQVADTGVYVIKMISYKGVCSSEQEKEMIVSTRSQLLDNGTTKTPFIHAFSATPNPSHGTFAAKVVLQDKAEVQLKLINILSNQTAYQIRKTGDSVYEIPINISILKGTYLLLLETPKGSSTVKVIIF